MSKKYKVIYSPSGAATIASAIKAQERFAVVRTADQAVVVFDYYYEKRQVYGRAYVMTLDRLRLIEESQGNSIVQGESPEKIADATVGVLSRDQWAGEDFRDESRQSFLFDEDCVEGFFHEVYSGTRSVVLQGRYLQELAKAC